MAEHASVVNSLEHVFRNQDFCCSPQLFFPFLFLAGVAPGTW